MPQRSAEGRELVRNKRCYVYEKDLDEIMQWGEKKVKEGLIPLPPNYKANFPYYLREYIKLLKSISENRCFLKKKGISNSVVLVFNLVKQNTMASYVTAG